MDIGICEGPFLPTLSKYFNQVVGLDIDYDYIKVAQSVGDCNSKSKKNTTLTIADGSKLPFKSNSFDIVFCLETLEHVTNISFVLGEISRVLRKGGVLISSIPIETGIPLLIRQIAGKILGFPRDVYSKRELLDGVIKMNLDIRREREEKVHSHRFFEWSNVLKELERTSLIIQSIVFTPFSKFRYLSTNVTFRAVNK